RAASCVWPLRTVQARRSDARRNSSSYDSKTLGPRRQEDEPNGLWRPSGSHGTVPPHREIVSGGTSGREGDRVNAVDGGGRAAILETEEARLLLESGQEAGSLTAEEIALALDELDLDASQLEDFYQ